MPSKGSVRVHHDGKGLQINLEHDLLAKADAKVVQGCFEALLNCAATHNCLSGSFKLTEPCFTTIARHNEASKCLAACFGCA